MRHTESRVDDDPRLVKTFFAPLTSAWRGLSAGSQFSAPEGFSRLRDTQYGQENQMNHTVYGRPSQSAQSSYNGRHPLTTPQTTQNDSLWPTGLGLSSGGGDISDQRISHDESRPQSGRPGRHHNQNGETVYYDPYNNMNPQNDYRPPSERPPQDGNTQPPSEGQPPPDGDGGSLNPDDEGCCCDCGDIDCSGLGDGCLSLAGDGCNLLGSVFSDAMSCLALVPGMFLDCK